MLATIAMAIAISPSIAMTLFYNTYRNFFFIKKKIHHNGNSNEGQ
jgi:hypothetical protein